MPPQEQASPAARPAAPTSPGSPWPDRLLPNATNGRKTAMRLGMLLRHSGGPIDLGPVLEAERLGYHSVWSGESYGTDAVTPRSEEHTSELQSLMRNSYAVFCLKKKK